MKAIILVGGQGTRMRPLTDHLPKNIVPLCGAPFLTYQFEYLKRAGVREVALSVGYLPKDIKKVYGTGKKLGIKIHYALEKEPLGTAGAIKNSEKYVKGHPVVVLNGDILTDIPLTKMIAHHRKQKNIATLGLFRVPDPTAYGLVLLDKKGQIEKFLEKPSPDQVVTDTINAGVYIFEPEVFDHIPVGQNYSAERALFPGFLAARERFGGFVWRGYWQDIGTPRKYLTTQWDVLKGTFPVHGPYQKKRKGIYLGKGVKMGKGVVLKGPSYIGDGCSLGDGARISPLSVLGPGCKIGKRATITKSLLWEKTEIGDGASLDETVLGRRCRVRKGAMLPKDTVLGDGEKI